MIDGWSKNGTLMSQSLGEGDLCRPGCSQTGTELSTCILVFIERNIDQGTKQRLQIHTIHSFSFSFPLSDLSFILVQVLWKFTVNQCFYESCRSPEERSWPLLFHNPMYRIRSLVQICQHYFPNSFINSHFGFYDTRFFSLSD